MNDGGDCRTAPATPGLLKLDGVGPVDNRPSTDKLHQIVTKKSFFLWYYEDIEEKAHWLN